MTTIIYAGLLLGILGLVFGGVLSFADKKFHVEVDERVGKVRECLGGANCGACGYAGCDAFAQAVVEGKAPVNGCAPAGAKGAQKIGQIMGLEAPDTERKVARVLCNGEYGISLNRYTYDGYQSCAAAASLAGGPKACRFSCIGLGDCMDKCAFGAIHMENGLARIDVEKCTGCGVCEKTCPRHVIKLMDLGQNVIVRCRNVDTARAARAACMEACIGCGRCAKECQYEAIKVENGYAHIDPAKCTRCGACAQVCPCKCITID